MRIGGALFLCLFASFGSPGRFLALFYKSYGLSDAQIGLLCSSGYLFSMFVAPMVNAIADRKDERELVCMIGLSISTASFLLQRTASVLSSSYVFPFLLLGHTISTMTGSATYPLVCAISISRLKEMYGDGAHDRFGQDRLWGAVSWATVSIIFGIIADYVGSVEMVTYFGLSFFGMIFNVTCSIARIYRTTNKALNNNSCKQDDECGDSTNEITAKNDDETERENRDKSENITPMRAIRELMHGGYPTMFFFLLAFVLEGGMSNVENLIFIYFKEDLGASYKLCGLTVLVTVIFEIPMFALAPELMKKLGSKYLAVLGSLSFVIRGIAYSMINNPWTVLIFEPLHGVTFASIATASVSFVSERSSKEIEATAQAILSALLSLANVTGVALGGIVMQFFGSRVVYRGAAIIVLIAIIAFLVVDKYFSFEYINVQDEDGQVDNENENLNGDEQASIECA